MQKGFCTLSNSIGSLSATYWVQKISKMCLGASCELGSTMFVSWLYWCFFVHKSLVPVCLSGCCFSSLCCTYLDWIVYSARWQECQFSKVFYLLCGLMLVFCRWWFHSFEIHLTIFESCFSVDLVSGEKYRESIVDNSLWILYISWEIYVCCCICASFHV